jgi:hypothetical protein
MLASFEIGVDGFSTIRVMYPLASVTTTPKRWKSTTT